MTRYDPGQHHRRSIRLPGYDYRSPGAYFVTVVAAGRECLFGTVRSGEMQSNAWGETVATCWQAIPQHFGGVELDAWVVMPNHLHGIIVIAAADGRGEASANEASGPRRTPAADASPLQPTRFRRPVGTQPGSLGAIVQNFKSVSTRRINALRRARSMPVWQRNYYEHVIRDEAAMQRCRRYIEENPARWALDPENPERDAS